MRTLYLSGVPVKFQKCLKYISWVISGTSSPKLACNPRRPSRNISCNHRHHLWQPSWRRIFSALNNQKTRVDSNINSDYKASPFEKLYMWLRKCDTAGFQRLGHTNGNIEMRSPSAAAMLTMVAATTIVRFAPVMCGAKPVSEPMIGHCYFHKIVDHSCVVGTSPVDAAPRTSSFST